MAKTEHGDPRFAGVRGPPTALRVRSSRRRHTHHLSGDHSVTRKDTKMMKHAIGYLLAMLVIAACGTGVDSDPRSTVGTVGSDGGDAASEGTSNPCAGADGPRHDYTTAYELTQLMTGTWVQCTPVSPTLLNGKGLEFLADGTYYLLVSDGHGGLARGTGFASQGAWEVKDIPE